MSRKIADADKKLGDGLEPLKNRDLRQELDGARTAVDRLHRTVNNVQTEMEPIKRDVTKATVSVDALDAKVASMANAIADLEKTASETRRTLSEHKKSTTSFLQDALDRIAAKFESLSAQTKEGISACGESCAAALRTAESAHQKASDLETSTRRLVDDLRESVNESLASARKAKESARKAAAEAQEALAASKRAEVAGEKALQATGDGPTAFQPVLARLVDETARLKDTVHDLGKEHRETAATAAGNKFKIAESRRDLQQLRREVTERSRDTAKLADRVAKVLHSKRGGAGSDHAGSQQQARLGVNPDGLAAGTRDAYVRSIDLGETAPWPVAGPPAPAWGGVYTGPPTWTPLGTITTTSPRGTLSGGAAPPSPGNSRVSEELKRLDELVERLKKRAKDVASRTSRPAHEESG